MWLSMQAHSRSDNLKLGLEYKDWELLGACARTMTKGLKHKNLTDQARETDRISLQVDDILAALRAEGHV